MKVTQHEGGGGYAVARCIERCGRRPGGGDLLLSDHLQLMKVGRVVTLDGFEVALGAATALSQRGVVFTPVRLQVYTNGDFEFFRRANRRRGEKQTDIPEESR